MDQRLRNLENDLDLLYNEIVPKATVDHERLAVINFGRAIKEFTDPANQRIQAELRKDDSLEFRAAIREIISKFRHKISNHFNMQST